MRFGVHWRGCIGRRRDSVINAWGRKGSRIGEENCRICLCNSARPLRQQILDDDSNFNDNFKE